MTYEELLNRLLADSSDLSLEKQWLVEQSRTLDLMLSAGAITNDPVGLEVLCDLLSLDPIIVNCISFYN